MKEDLKMWQQFCPNLMASHICWTMRPVPNYRLIVQVGQNLAVEFILIVTGVICLGQSIGLKLEVNLNTPTTRVNKFIRSDQVFIAA